MTLVMQPLADLILSHVIMDDALAYQNSLEILIPLKAVNQNVSFQSTVQETKPVCEINALILALEHVELTPFVLLLITVRKIFFR
jgi:hypothetical protein